MSTAREDRTGLGRQLAATLGWLVAVGLVVLVVARLVGLERGPVWSLGMGLLPYALCLAFPLLVGAALLRRRALSTVALLLGLVQVLVVAPSTGGQPGPCRGAPLRVVGANLLYTNPQSAAAGRAIAAVQPDLVVLPELTAGAVPALEPLLQQLPQQAIAFQPASTSPGLATRLPVSDVVEQRREDRFWPEVTVDVAGLPVRVLGVHTQPPLEAAGRPWVADLQHLGDRLDATPGAAVALGDFNAGRDHASFRALLTGGVRDAHEQVGKGLARTWPAGTPLLHLDHVLVKDGGGVGIDVCSVRELSVPGSDHLAVVADLALRRLD